MSFHNASPVTYAYFLGRRLRPRRELYSLYRLLPGMKEDLRLAYEAGRAGR